jgi:hypothetical protein
METDGGDAMKELEEKLAELQTSIQEGTYRVGDWQRLVSIIDGLPYDDKQDLSLSISETSNLLNQRHGFLCLPFAAGFMIEFILAMFGFYILYNGTANPAIALMASVALILSLQPFLKIIVGFLLGVRYAYVYLFYIEPRFKTQYGTYLTLSPTQRIAYHLSGIVGTPLALYLALAILGPAGFPLIWIWLLFWGAIAVQLLPFIAEWFGLKKLGPFRLSVLTGAAMVAVELKKMVGRSG